MKWRLRGHGLRMNVSCCMLKAFSIQNCVTENDGSSQCPRAGVVDVLEGSF